MSRRLTPAAVALAACTALLCGCSGGSGGTPASEARQSGVESAGSVTSRLGAVPIPTPDPEEQTPVASRRHPQLLAIGEPMKLDLPRVDAIITALGPYEATPYRGGPSIPTSTAGVITIKVEPTVGSITLKAADFLSRDETGQIVSLAPHGPSSVTASPSHPAVLRVEGRYESGAAQVTWRYQGDVLAIWDFNIELD